MSILESKITKEYDKRKIREFFKRRVRIIFKINKKCSHRQEN